MFVKDSKNEMKMLIRSLSGLVFFDDNMGMKNSLKRIFLLEMNIHLIHLSLNSK